MLAEQLDKLLIDVSQIRTKKTRIKFNFMGGEFVSFPFGTEVFVDWVAGLLVLEDRVYIDPTMLTFVEIYNV